MSVPNPPKCSPASLQMFLLALADDELVLGHRDSEWTGHAPILEEDIAFSNIAQDEIGHSLVWYSLHQDLTDATPDTMVFTRSWTKFVCSRFVEYPKGDFAYTVVRQFLFDCAELIRLKDLTRSSYTPLAQTAERIIKEEHYHRLHSQGLVERLGDATEESARRMQAAVDQAFPQSLGLFELLDCENELKTAGVFSGHTVLRSMWLDEVVPVLRGVSLKIPVVQDGAEYQLKCEPEDGGRKKLHTPHLQQLVHDLQSVHKLAPEARW